MLHCSFEKIYTIFVFLENDKIGCLGSLYKIIILVAQTQTCGTCWAAALHPLSFWTMSWVEGDKANGLMSLSNDVLIWTEKGF